MIIYIKIIVGPLRCMMPSMQKSWITICHNKQTIISNFPILPVCSEIWPPHLNLARYFLSQHKSFWSQSNLETYMILLTNIFVFVCRIPLHNEQVCTTPVGSVHEIYLVTQVMCAGWVLVEISKMIISLTNCWPNMYIVHARTHARTPALTHSLTKWLSALWLKNFLSI